MSLSRKYCLVFLFIAVAAAALRLPKLNQRPMHTDESVHAEKFRTLLEHGSYHYDKDEFHGPTLNYFTLIPAWLSSAENLTQTTEFSLRIVPALFSILLIFLLLLLSDGIGPFAISCAAALTAISPAMVFYSRYYIQETLLVCFTFGVIVSAYRYSKNKTLSWAILTGIFVGLTHATKETSIIVFASMLLAILLTAGSNLRKLKPAHIAIALAAAVIVSALFYSSFFTNPAGIADSYRTYANYFHRAGNQNTAHIHPWYYYLKMLIYSKYFTGPLWTEALIVILAIVGFIAAIKKKLLPEMNLPLIRFIAIYTIIMTVIYSAIPYKTPWCMLGFLHGMIILAAVGATVLIKLLPNSLARRIVSVLLLLGAIHLTQQSYAANYKYYADPRNPYVYAHTSNDIFKIIKQVEQVAKTHPKGRNMPIQIFFPGDDYWPLPWYLRSYPNVWLAADIDPDIKPAPLILAPASMESELQKFFNRPPPGKKDLYLPLFSDYTELRPKLEIRGYITKELYDRTSKND